jgi:hypothetical protein
MVSFKQPYIYLNGGQESSPCYIVKLMATRIVTMQLLVAAISSAQQQCFYFLITYISSFQVVITAGLLKDGLCSVQDESAGHLTITFI